MFVNYSSGPVGNIAANKNEILVRIIGNTRL